MVLTRDGTQGVALGWDMAAPLALSKCKSRSRFPTGMTERKAKATALARELVEEDEEESGE